MADKKKMSVDEMLAALRGGSAGESSDDATPAKPEEATPVEAPAAEEKPAAPPASGKKPGEMSVAEMLAAAREGASGGGKAKEEPTSKAESVPAAASPKKKPGEMSVAEMLASARTGGKAEEKPKPAAKKPSAKPKPKPAAAKAEKPSPAGLRDTASILAAARKSSKPGPVSKAAAAEAARGDGAAKKPGKQKLAVPPMPTRPVFAAPASRAAVEEDRRGFFSTLMGVFFGSALGVGFTSLGLWHILGVLGLARFMFPNILTEPPTKFKVGFPDEFAPGQVETKFKAQFGVWIVRSEYEGTPCIVALQSVCTHLGCTPNWLEGEQKFKCPCHGSGFYKEGINFEGPAPRPLERFAVRLADDGQLEVDKSLKFQEELGQWKDAASFVPV